MEPTTYTFETFKCPYIKVTRHGTEKDEWQLKIGDNINGKITINSEHFDFVLRALLEINNREFENDDLPF